MNGARPLTAEHYRFLQRHIQLASGIVLADDKHYLLEARLAPILRQRQISSLADLCFLLQRAGGDCLTQEVVDAIATNETFFFRDVQVWTALKQSVLPKLMERRRSRRSLNCWSAAASTGQEAYSLLMTLLDAGLQDWNLEILGTDISFRVIERARRGLYTQTEVNRGLPASCLVKYFTQAGHNWQIHDKLRSRLRFEQLDLRDSLRNLGPFDLVLCRNVLIYFSDETQTQILREISRRLSAGGYLVLGCAETVRIPQPGLIPEIFERTAVYRSPGISGIAV